MDFTQIFDKTLVVKIMLELLQDKTHENHCDKLCAAFRHALQELECIYGYYSIYGEIGRERSEDVMVDYIPELEYYKPTKLTKDGLWFPVNETGLTERVYVVEGLLYIFEQERKRNEKS